MNAETKTGLIRLKGNMSIEKAHGIYRSLADVVGKFDRISLDLSAVDKVDFSFLQILCSFCQTVIQHGGTFRIVKTSEAFDKATARAGFFLEPLCETSDGQDCAMNRAKDKLQEAK